MLSCRRMQMLLNLSHHTKLKSKQIRDLNINPIKLKLIEEKMGSILECIHMGDNSLNGIPAVQTQQSTNNKQDFLKLKSCCKAKDTV